jgi:hypothetical protein
MTRELAVEAIEKAQENMAAAARSNSVADRIHLGTSRRTG